MQQGFDFCLLLSALQIRLRKKARSQPPREQSLSETGDRAESIKTHYRELAPIA
ncbi:MAG: hypothetical protein F6J95_003195 [Leptolyngbya sp. SIO1E4]|nr:hypothetical protein [Leptolyngbya sp. SIO1E4]